MLHQLLDRSEDLKRLRDEGFEMEVKGGYLLIHHIPYVNNAGEVKYGSLISELTLSHNSQTTKPSTHVIHFAGGHPCNRDGTQISAIRHGSQRQNFGEG